MAVTYISLISASLSNHRLTVSQYHLDQSANSGTSNNNGSNGTSQIHPSKIAAYSLAGDEAALYQCADTLNRLAHEYTVLRTFVTSTPNGTSHADDAAAATGGSSQQSDTAVEVQQTLCLILAFAIQRIAKSLTRISSGKLEASSKRQKKINDGEDTDMIELGQGSSSATATATIEADENDVFDIDPLLIPLLGQLDQVMVNGSADMMTDNEEKVNNKPKTFAEVFKSSSGLTLQYLCENLQGQSDHEDEALSQLERGISIVQQLLSRHVAFPIWIPQEFFVSRQSSSPHQASSLNTTNQFGFSI